MAYSSVANVQSEFRKIEFGTDTTVTETEVEDFISEADALIDSIIGLRYIVPVSSSVSPNGFKILKMISRKLVAMRVKAILEVKDASADAVNQDVRADFSKSDLLKMLKDIASGKILLDDAVLISSGQGLSSFNVETNQEADFKKNVNQW